MNKTFQLDIITPTSTISEGQVEYLRAPSVDGLFGVQSRHVSSIITLDIGEIKVTKDSGEQISYSTSGGYADIRQEGVVLLVENVEKASEIDTKRAMSAQQRAEKNLKDPEKNLKRAIIALNKAKNRVRISSLADGSLPKS